MANHLDRLREKYGDATPAKPADTVPTKPTKGAFDGFVGTRPCSFVQIASGAGSKPMGAATSPTAPMRGTNGSPLNTYAGQRLVIVGGRPVPAHAAVGRDPADHGHLATRTPRVAFGAANPSHRGLSSSSTHGASPHRRQTCGACAHRTLTVLGTGCGVARLQPLAPWPAWLDAPECVNSCSFFEEAP
jgi:hypothetical protein